MIWTNQYHESVPHQLDVPPLTVDALLEDAAVRYPNRNAVIGCGRSYTYKEVWTAACAISAALHRAGVGKGQRVAILMPNLPPFVSAYIGVLRSGAVAVLINPLLPDADILTILEDAEPHAVITTRMFWPLVGDREYRLVLVAHIRDYLKGMQPTLLPLLAQRATAMGADIPISDRVQWLQDVVKTGWDYGPGATPDDVALLQYTSGSTGPPKGVLLTHRNLVANALQIRHWYHEAREGAEVVLAALPLGHIYGVAACLHNAMLLGATVVVLPAFSAREVLDAVKTHRPTLFPGTPGMYVHLTEHPEIRKSGLNGIRFCISGSAPLPMETQEAFERLTRGRLVEGYGLSEAIVTHVNPMHRDRTGSIGVPLPGTQARIVHPETGEAVAPRQPGELEIRGPQVMRGYWKRPDLTDAVLRDGWLRTGDLAAMDEDGYFQLIGRSAEAIHLADGRVVYPRDVEEVLYEHEHILECAVIGVRHQHEVRIKALVVPRRSHRIEPRDIIEFCKRRLSPYKVPQEVEVRGPLPRNPLGKVMYRLLHTQEQRESEVLGASDFGL